MIALLFVLLFSVSGAIAQIANHIVISEVYGGGGNSGAQYQNDYVVLYNPTGAGVNITGWSLQYASTGGSWNATIDGPLSGMIASHGFFLIQCAAGSNTGLPAVPSPDADFSSTSPNFSATNGTIALVDTVTQLSGDPSGNISVLDYVGYGSPKYYQGTAVAALSNTTSAMRKAQSTSTSASMENGGADSLLGNGWDTGNNSADFVVRYPSPRNSSSPPETPPVVLNTPPIISGIGRAVFVPSAGTADSVTADIVDNDGTVTGAVLHVRRNKGAWDSTITMTHVGSTYVGIVSAAKNVANGDLIEYYISATDDSAAESSTAGALQGYFVGNVKISAIKASSLSAIVNYGIQVRGIINVRTNTFTNGQGYIQDSTGGLQMFLSGGLPDLAAGRNAYIQGTLNNFQNAYELSTPNFKFIDTTGTATLTPVTVTLPLSESATNIAEGKLIQIAGMTTDSIGIFSSSKDYIYKDGLHDTISVFVQSNGTLNGLVGKTIPAGSVTAKGILIFSGSSLSLKPRQATDMGVPAGDGTGTVTISPTFRFQNVPAVKETLIVAGDGINTLSGCSITVPSAWIWDGSSRNISGTG
ncbi:MAG TPA: lamin tail domain-containing protein, partial [Bacteroidota bacterium]|nr:lamin tail domain-containing protein [Bacteroidota bacterium]